MNWKPCSTISLVLILSACASSKPIVLPPKPVVITEYVYADCGIPPARSPVELRRVEWLIYEVNGEQRFTLTAKQYENLGYNTSEIIKGAKELKAEIGYYVACIKHDATTTHSP